MRPTRRSYGLVLALVVATTFVQLIVSGSDGARFAVIVIQAATLVAAVRTVRTHQVWLQGAAVVGALTVAAALVLWLARGDIPKAPSAIASGLLVAVAPPALFSALMRDLRGHGVVTLETLSGVLAVYLLVGNLFTFGYGVVDALDPGGLFGGDAAATTAEHLYFSFVTLCTVGYGDFVPVSDVARSLAVTEMLIGQIYLVTVVGLIVGNLRPRAERAR